MSEQGPPDHSPDGVVDEVIEQVQRALDEAQVTLGPAREQLRTELLAAFRMVGRDFLGARPGAGAPAGAEPGAREPELSVVEGGREPDAPRTAAAGPELAVAEDEQAGAGPRSGDHAGGAATADEGPTTPGLRWVMRSGKSRLGAPGVPGKLRLAPPTDQDDGWQTLFRASGPRTYRIHCDTGELEVAIDGLPGERVRSGCSMDVEARMVRVRARPGGSVSARYRRISLSGED